MRSVFVLDNDAITGISSLAGLSDQHRDMNILTAQLVSGVTQAIRFDGCLYDGMKHYTSQFVPYERIKFLSSSFGPFISPNRQLEPSPTVFEICESFCNPANNFAGKASTDGKIMSCCLQFAGQVVPKDVGQKAIMMLKRNFKWVEWASTGFKCGLTYNMPKVFPNSGLVTPLRTGTMISNMTSAFKTFEGACTQFDENLHNKSMLNLAA